MESAPENRLTARQRKAFLLARNTAAKVVQRRFRILKLARQAFNKMAGHERALTKVQDDLSLLVRLSKAWARREYRAVPWKSLLYAVAAVVYFVNPVDLIPDVLAGLGFVDDVAVIGAVAGAIRNDLEFFREWENEHKQLKT